MSDVSGYRTFIAFVLDELARSSLFDSLRTEEVAMDIAQNVGLAESHKTFTFNPAVLISRFRCHQVMRRNIDAEQYQREALSYCVQRARDTKFGCDHDFEKIRSYEEYRDNVPLREAVDFDSYWNLILQGNSDICWPGKSPYVLYSGGTTSGGKRIIPVTREGVRT